MVDRVLECQTPRGSFDKLPTEMWLVIGKFLHSKSDLARLSRVNKSLCSLFTFARAKVEADIHSYRPRSMPSMLYVALKRGRPLAEIKNIVAGYVAGYEGCGIFLLETHANPVWPPPLHLAVRLNRIRVVDLILSAGVDINIKWGGHADGECPNYAHIRCEGRWIRNCKNALDAARESENSKIERYLLRKGIEDIGQHEIYHAGGLTWYQDEYSIDKDWWPIIAED
ncbi:hypothetical protein F4782DRAFT_549774 [Xylaria castorea]|nr:hypothetical protein F4782DRAFT_549774 [Xylaria castorea]